MSFYWDEEMFATLTPRALDDNRFIVNALNAAEADVIQMAEATHCCLSGDLPADSAEPPLPMIFVPPSNNDRVRLLRRLAEWLREPT